MRVTKEMIEKESAGAYELARGRSNELAAKLCKEMFDKYEPGQLLSSCEISEIINLVILEASDSFTIEYVNQMLLRLFGGDATPGD